MIFFITPWLLTLVFRHRHVRFTAIANKPGANPYIIKYIQVKERARKIAGTLLTVLNLENLFFNYLMRPDFPRFLLNANDIHSRTVSRHIYSML